MKKICFFIDNISHIGGTERVCLLITCKTSDTIFLF